MNETIIMSMVSPYVRQNTISYDNFENLFSSILSQQEQYEVIALLADNGIELLDNTLEDNNTSIAADTITDSSKYYEFAKPYLKNGYLTYEDFDNIFAQYTRKQQYVIVEELFSYGVELIDISELTDSSNLDIAQQDIFDPINIIIDDDRKKIPNDSVFLDKSSESSETFKYSSVNQSNENLCYLIQSGNKQAEQDICIKNKRLVCKYANTYYGSFGNNLEFEDLEQVGYMGLIKAAKRFDLNSGNAFSTYAIFWIKQAITREIADNGYTIRLPVHIMEKIAKITKINSELEKSDMSYEEKIESIADTLNMTTNEVRYIISLRQQYRKCASLNTLVGEDGETELEAFIQDYTVSIEEQIENKYDKNEVQSLLSNLGTRPREVLEWRYGLIDGQKHTLEDIAEKYGVTRERIRQIEEKALKRLKGYLRENKKKWRFR